MKKGYQGNVLLVELIVVVLFFSLSAVISLGVFVNSRGLEKAAATLTSADQQARNWCETLAVRPDAEDFLTEAGFLEADGAYTAEVDGLHWTAQVSREASEAGELVTTVLTACGADGETAVTGQTAVYYFPGEVS